MRGKRRSEPAADPPAGEIAAPYWALEPESATGAGLAATLRQLPGTSRPILAIVYRSAPRSAVAMLVLLVLSGVLSMAGLLATTTVLDRLLAGGAGAGRVVAALPALALVAAVYSCRGALEAAVGLARAKVAPAVRRESATRLVAAAVRVELAAYDDDSFYDRMHRARDRGLVYLDRSVDSLVELTGAALGVLAAAGTLLILHPLLIAVLTLSIVPEAWAVLRSAQLGYRARRRMTPLSRRQWTLDVLTTGRPAATDLRSYQAEPFVLAEYHQVAGAVQAAESSVEVEQARVQAIGRALSGLGSAATFGTLGLLLHAGWIALAVAGGSALAIRTATAAIGRLVAAANQLFEQGLYVRDYQDFLADAERRSRPAGGLPVAGGPQHIDLDGVCFRYPGSVDVRPALSEVSLSIRAGRTVALVGENGSGKTTLAKLIAGLYLPTAGEIRWDGRPLPELDPQAVAAQVVVVSQNPMRWPHTARTNVRLGRHDRHDPADAELTAAAAQARADEVIAGLPDGWQTMLSKEFRGGHELSGGQWQRMAIARALFRDAPVLICDEPTAPLDAHAELAVYESLRRLADGRTIVLISHRLASVRHADQILVLHRGRIVERGRHEELMAAGGLYHRMYTVQAKLTESGLAL
jgi:ATP-binding cassette, subfamily B, bacterial